MGLKLSQLQFGLRKLTIFLAPFLLLLLAQVAFAGPGTTGCNGDQGTIPTLRVFSDPCE